MHGADLQGIGGGEVREYTCPDKIAALFDSIETANIGRDKAYEWASNLDLRVGDRIWLPEIGWATKESPRRDN